MERGFFAKYHRIMQDLLDELKARGAGLHIRMGPCAQTLRCSRALSAADSRRVLASCWVHFIPAAGHPLTRFFLTRLAAIRSSCYQAEPGDHCRRPVVAPEPGSLCSGPPADDDESLGAHLLRIRDARGRPLPDERLLPHLGMMFFAGSDTTAHTMTWSLCDAADHSAGHAALDSARITFTSAVFAVGRHDGFSHASVAGDMHDGCCLQVPHLAEPGSRSARCRRAAEPGPARHQKAAAATGSGARGSWQADLPQLCSEGGAGGTGHVFCRCL